MTDQANTTGRKNRNMARRTRRQLLAGGTGALAAVLTAETVARPARAWAANGHDVILGQDNAATATTVIQNSSSGSGQAALHGVGSGDTSGLSGFSDSGAGLLGGSGTGHGVSGSASAGQGVYGQSGATASGLVPVRHGVHGITDNPQGFGVVGETAADTGTAVAGIGGQFGVSGTGTSVGVVGGGGDIGVRGLGGSPGGIGVQGEGDEFGIGVLATGGTALSVDGPAVFSRSGILTVPRGHTSAAQTMSQFSRSTLVLAVVQEDLDGVWVRSAVPDPAAQRFTVHLNKPAPARVKVAWFLVN